MYLKKCTSLSEVLDCLVCFLVSIEDPLCIWNCRQTIFRWVVLAIVPTTSITTTAMVIEYVRITTTRSTSILRTFNEFVSVRALCSAHHRHDHQQKL